MNTIIKIKLTILISIHTFPKTHPHGSPTASRKTPEQKQSSS